MIGLEEIPEFSNKIRILDGKYQILYTIGEGRYAKVKLGIDIERKKKVAIKIIKEQIITDESSLDLFINEVKILSQITPNENIVQIQRVFLNGKYTKCDGREYPVLYYIMKIAENGELFKFLLHTPKFEEDLARFFFKQILESLEYLHFKGIAHRDIKPENILIDKNLKIKLCDFGFSTKCRNDKGESILFDPIDPVGSPEYNPPEITQNLFSGQKYNSESMDLFQSACVLFMMVMSSAPFANTTKNDRYYSRFCMDNKANFWKIFIYNNKPTNEFKDFMHSMLEQDPSKRLNIKQIKMHSWMNGPIPSLEEVQQQMNERICVVFNKTLEELKKKIESKSLTKKEKPHLRTISNMEGLKNKYQKQIHDINQQIFRKIQNCKKQKILMKQAQPEQNIPHPLEESLLKQKEDCVSDKQQLNQTQNEKINIESSLNQSLFNRNIQPVQNNKLEKNIPQIKQIIGNLEESKTDSKGAHVDERQSSSFLVAPYKKTHGRAKMIVIYHFIKKQAQKLEYSALIIFSDQLIINQLNNQIEHHLLLQVLMIKTQLLKTQIKVKLPNNNR